MNLVLYFFATIFVLLLIGLLYTLVKDFKEIARGLINMCKPQLFHPITWILSPIWLIGYALDEAFGIDIVDKYNDSEGLEKYPSTKNLQLDFSIGDKYIISMTSKKKSELLIEEFLEFCDGNLRFENFKIKNTNPVTAHCPNNISFYDFNILTQHFCNDIKKSWGIFKSGRLNYYSYLDDKTVHNIVGQTKEGQKFSIYTLDDLYKDQYLKINQELSVKKFDWNLINNGEQQYP